jgi:hypothetical protein
MDCEIVPVRQKQQLATAGANRGLAAYQSSVGNAPADLPARVNADYRVIPTAMEDSMCSYW